MGLHSIVIINVLVNEAIPCNVMQLYAISYKNMQYNTISCNISKFIYCLAIPNITMQYIAVLCITFDYHTIYHARVADVGGARERRSTTGQGLLRQEGPPTYAILSRNSVLSRFTRFLKGFCRALNESHPAFVEHSTKAILLS